MDPVVRQTGLHAPVNHDIGRESRKSQVMDTGDRYFSFSRVLHQQGGAISFSSVHEKANRFVLPSPEVCGIQILRIPNPPNLLARPAVPGS